jgi:maltose alpha-D-glucosyltransferase / alpha-amylase
VTPPPDGTILTDPDWYRDAVIYSCHVRSFQDSDGDGFGDFRGLADRLDYLQDLGVTAIWLLPFYPSPLRDDGYDIADYTAIHPDYGTMRQFKRFVKQAHDRGLKVITELVINHTSDQHPWFKRAVAAPKGSRYRDWYVWSDTADPYPEVRIIFQDFETSNWTWHPEAEQYYWHRFFSHQPDLNFDNPEVQDALAEVLDFWAEIGVDGFRLDAIPYLYEREGTNGENLPETHDYLKKLRAHLDERWPGRMFLAEANQWPEDAAEYFGDGDECHMNFHFPLMPRLFMAVRQEDRFPVIDILQQTPEIPDGTQWALFLRNHDELTLEMVTDEERDFMYRAYAHDARMRINLGIRRRLAPLLGGDRRLIELMNSLLFSMPGTPCLYYGDEIGMGDNIWLGDRNGVRTPMQWAADRNAGFSSANPQKLYLPVVIDPEYHYERINVESQQENASSLLLWMKRLIALRQRHTQVFGRGDIEFVHPTNHKVLAYVRRWQPPEGGPEQRILVVANLSRHAQAAQLPLDEHTGLTPVEMFGRTAFPAVTDQPYTLTLGPYQFYWFALERAPSRLSLSQMREDAAAETVESVEQVPELTVAGEWTALLRGRGKERLEAQLPAILRRQRWFGGKARELATTHLVDVAPLGKKDAPAMHVAVVRVEYVDGEPEEYVLALAFAEGEDAGRIAATAPTAVLAQVKGRGPTRPERRALRRAPGRRRRDARRGRGARGRPARHRRPRPTVAHHQRRTRRSPGPATRHGRRTRRAAPEGPARRAVQHLDRVRRPLPDEGAPSPGGGRVAGRGDRPVPRRPGRPRPGAGGHHRPRSRVRAPATSTVAILQRFVPNEGDAWVHTLDELERYAERVLTDPPHGGVPDLRRRPLELAEEAIPESAHELVGPYLDVAHLLGVGRPSSTSPSPVARGRTSRPNPSPASTSARCTSRCATPSVAASRRRTRPRGRCSTRTRRRGCASSRPGRARSSTASAPCRRPASRRCGPARTATTTSGRCCGPAATSSSSTSRANPPVRSVSGG